jgi:hypothetical protein
MRGKGQTKEQERAKETRADRRRNRRINMEPGVAQENLKCVVGSQLGPVGELRADSAETQNNEYGWAVDFKDGLSASAQGRPGCCFRGWAYAGGSPRADRETTRCNRKESDVQHKCVPASARTSCSHTPANFTAKCCSALGTQGAPRMPIATVSFSEESGCFKCALKGERVKVQRRGLNNVRVQACRSNAQLLGPTCLSCLLWLFSACVPTDTVGALISTHSWLISNACEYRRTRGPWQPFGTGFYACVPVAAAVAGSSMPPLCKYLCLCPLCI